ncbi:YheU family protein [Methylococcus sp. EFPC2]|uniref:YheU family protein n=1 Tax=Methylococcus sp. EFPC2 TaxID=2812648 RepID=UPI0019679EC6|nr:YheU family protein [Methylococcus sp. EFPC2]QSA96510.1 YheU family protein [Methylococcus sp. EFPC2]
MLIPHRQLSVEALRGLIEEFVTRDGTDYGEIETTLADKVAMIERELERGLAFVVYDEEDGGVTIIARQQLPPELVKSIRG